MDTFALILSVIGSLNWGLVGIFRFDLVAWIFGGQTSVISRIIYTLVGLAGIWCISFLFRKRARSGAGAGAKPPAPPFMLSHPVDMPTEKGTAKFRRRLILMVSKEFQKILIVRKAASLCDALQGQIRIEHQRLDLLHSRLIDRLLDADAEVLTKHAVEIVRVILHFPCDI